MHYMPAKEAKSKRLVQLQFLTDFAHNLNFKVYLICINVFAFNIDVKALLCPKSTLCVENKNKIRPKVMP